MERLAVCVRETTTMKGKTKSPMTSDQEKADKWMQTTGQLLKLAASHIAECKKQGVGPRARTIGWLEFRARALGDLRLTNNAFEISEEFANLLCRLSWTQWREYELAQAIIRTNINQSALLPECLKRLHRNPFGISRNPRGKGRSIQETELRDLLIFLGVQRAVDLGLNAGFKTHHESHVPRLPEANGVRLVHEVLNNAGIGTITEESVTRVWDNHLLSRPDRDYKQNWRVFKRRMIELEQLIPRLADS